MKAMVLKNFGGVENFEIQDIDHPQPTDDQVLIEVQAIGINPIDVKTRKGEGMASKYNGNAPIVIGWDVSGIITEIGKDVRTFKIGDEVFGTIDFPGRGGAYAKYIAASANQITKKPSNISHNEAAIATLSALTAWQALVDNGKIKKDDKVLIHGGAGGVGNYAVQIAKYFGTYIVATAAGEDTGFVKELGADEIIDYKTQRFEEITKDFDFILDTIGGDNFVRSLNVLKPEGTIVLLPSNKKDEAEKAAKEHNIKNYKHILMHSSGKDIKQIASMLENGSMKVHLDRVFTFEQLPDAHTALEEGKIKGKIAVAGPDVQHN